MITLFTKTNCIYCTRAINLLESIGIKAYSAINLDNDMEHARRLVSKTSHRTFPFVFVGSKFVGGFTELQELNSSGDLQDMLEDTFGFRSNDVEF